MTLPVFALIGRPNVGKSTLFNALTRSRNAIVADVPGVTRDRQYGIGRLAPEAREFLVVDTGGITIAEKDGVIDQNEIRVLRNIVSKIKPHEVDAAMRQKLMELNEKINR